MYKDYLDEIIDTFNILREKNEVAEVRILNTRKGTYSGYFNDPMELWKSVEGFNGENDIYITLNPVNPSLLARADNKLKPYAKTTTNDKDIEKINFILIDLDPVRPSGISSTEMERTLAKNKALEIKEFLIEKGFPEPMMACSGNGYHLILYTDLENKQENIEIIKKFLNALDFLFSDETVQVDTSTYNPSRITKLYGTTACKGDNTEDRPHRQSKLVYIPEELVVTTISKLESIIELMPKIEVSQKTPKKNESISFDIEDWINKNNIRVAYSAPFHNEGKKYILSQCPWNPEHTDKSAYIIQFNNGAIAAGCHHNSCSEENWKTLRALVEPEAKYEKSVSSNNRSSNEKENQSDTIIRLAENAEYYCNDIEESYGTVKINGHKEVMKIKSKKFKLWLSKLYYETKGQAPNKDAMNQALGILEMKSMFSGIKRKLERRVAKYKDDFYYDLLDSKWRAIKISKDGCDIEENPPTLFIRSKNMKEQVIPDFSVKESLLIDYITKHFRFKTEQDKILYAIYLVTCFVADIPHPILVLHGEKGSAKSTTMRMTRSIVDSARIELQSMPTSNQDLALSLANNYMPCFDNLDAISVQKSDMLCTAATGGAFSKRELYTDDEECIISFKRCVILNGINIVATRADLLDRSIIAELERISFDERKTEKDVWDEFEFDKPKILGTCLMTLSKAMKIYPEVKIDKLGRMADFTMWGYAVAEALGVGGKIFLQAYLNNQNKANDEAISSNPVAATIVVMMRDCQSWKGSVSALHKELEKIAYDEMINTRGANWPKASHVLSKRLKEIKSNLEQVGIYFDIRHAGNYKEVTIEKKA